MIGRRLSHYRIEERLGAGGMGEVYRARDEKLGRDVALKVLPAGALTDDETRRRFRKEAEALSRLSHPHVATLFDFDTAADGIDFLVMELVVGPTLEEELRKGPLAEKDVVRLGAQLARGLAAAHEHGVIHRDLKPSNLQLTSDGLLKILDFGVARLERAKPPAGNATATETGAEKVLGSPPYMAPEQVLGKTVDARTDLYTAGACLYELGTGKRPFGEKRGAPLTEAILHESPVAPRSANPALSSGLEAVILKALDKDPGLRYQTAKELLVDLERLLTSGTTGASSQAIAVAKTRSRWPLALAAAALVAITAAALILRPLPPPRITAVRSLAGNLQSEAYHPKAGIDSLATDGQRIYYLSGKDSALALFQVPVGGGEPVEIPLPFPAERGIFSYVPSQSALLMRGAREVVYETPSQDAAPPLWLVQVPAGVPRRVGNLTASWADASPDGRRLVLTRGHRLLLAPIDGQSERELVSLRSAAPIRPRWAPDGRHIRFDLTESGARDVWIWQTSTEGEAPRPLWRGSWGNWVAGGRHFVFWRNGELFSVRERRWPWEPAEPVRLTVGPVRYAQPELSPDGQHIFAFGTSSRGQLMKLEGATKRFASALGGESAFYAEPSPDGRWLAWVRYPDGTLWRSRPDGSERLQLAGAPMEAHLPRWSPDGQRIVFVTRTVEDPQLVVRVVWADASSAETIARPEKPDLDYWDPCWLPDGSIVFDYLRFWQPAGLLRYDPTTRRVAPIAGAESKRWATCSARGDLLAQGVEGEASRYHLRSVRSAVWESLDLPVTGMAYPSWRRDGRSFCAFWITDLTIKCYSIKDRRLETLASARGLPLAIWMFVPWMGLDADGLPFVTADRSTRALYALDLEAP